MIRPHLLALTLSLLACDDATAPLAGGTVYDALVPVDAALPDATLPDAALPDAATEPPFEPWTVAVRESALTDATRDRQIGLAVYAPEGLPESVPVILVSHGGDGSNRGQRALAHLGRTFAAHGYLAIHLGHRPSESNLAHRLDRPADVSHVLDRLAAGDVPYPPGFTGLPDLSRVGHAGHSWGAYTSHAVGGATFDQGTFGDPRVRAIVPISPQGAGGFGAFDRGPEDNTWRTVTVPVLTYIGETEKNGPAGQFEAEDWRLQPFERYPEAGDAFMAVLPGQDHSQMGSGGSVEVQAYIANNARLFFDVYVADREADACQIGQLNRHPQVTFARKVDPNGHLVACPR